MPRFSSWAVPLAAASALAAGATWLWATQGWRQGVLLLLGAGLGIALLQANFGFTGGLRSLIGQRRSAGVRAQLLLIAATLLLFAPVLEAGEALGTPVRGFVFPIGWALLLGAFLFGLGMQLGGGCGSGTLYTAGAGAARMWLTLAAFVGGATLAAWRAELWSGWAALPPVSFPALLGPLPAALLGLALLGLGGLGAAALERRRHGTVAPIGGRFSLIPGPWPLLWGALALAVLSLATLVVAGRPWAITAAFPLWGAKLIEALGLDDPAFWAYWEDPTRTEALFRPLAADRTTVMDLGVMLGAALAAGVAGRRAPLTLPRPGEAASSVLGGLLLGIGAVLGMGCNISAWLGGIASGSLHGWVWIWPALAGNALGVRVRPLFGLGRI
jgi:uncharacterized membrane protein YedE/YeeE